MASAPPPNKNFPYIKEGLPGTVPSQSPPSDAAMVETVDDEDDAAPAPFNSMEFDADNEWKWAAEEAARAISETTDKCASPAPLNSILTLPSSSLPAVAAMAETVDDEDDAAPAPFNSMEFDADNERKWAAAGAARAIVETTDKCASPAPLNSLLTQRSTPRTDTSDQGFTLDSRKCASADGAQQTDPSDQVSTQVSIREDILHESGLASNEVPSSHADGDGGDRDTDDRTRQLNHIDFRSRHVDDARAVVDIVERDSIFRVPEATLVVEKDEEVYLATPIEQTPLPEPSLPWWKQRRIRCLLGVMFLIVVAFSIGISQLIDVEPAPSISVALISVVPSSSPSSLPSSSPASSIIPSSTSPLSSATCETDPACGATLDTWTGISGGIGGGIADLEAGTDNMANMPNKTERLISQLEAPSNFGDSYGSRMKGWLVPPITGEYEFFIASGGHGEFWLSFDDHPANKEVKCYQPDYGGVGEKEWMTFPEQKSDPIQLVRSRAYYYEVLMMDVDGDDNLAIAWLYPSQVLEVIPAWYSRTIKPGWPTTCSVDSDCDDGLWCNGDETCNKVSVCQFGLPQTCFDELLCTDDVCNESTKSCENPIKDICGATWDTWNDIYGWTVADLMIGTNNLANAPSMSERLQDLLEAPSFYGEHFGGRMKGWLVPPITGNYTFWIAADDDDEFWLSSDDDPANKVLRCSTRTAVSQYFFTSSSEQKSEPITLVANMTYYFEALLMEDTWANHLAIAWEYPDQTFEVIPAIHSKMAPA